MSSFLKPELTTPEDAEAQPAAPAAAPVVVPVTVSADAAAHVPHASDVAVLVETAHEHIEKLVTTELAQIQSILSAAWRQTEESLARARAENAEMKRQLEAMKVLNAENERKVAVLEEVKKRLAGL